MKLVHLVQIIDNFAVYNSEGFMSTLELLPMWQNVDSDVELFGSGIISQMDDDDSEWSTGHALSNLSALLPVALQPFSLHMSLAPCIAIHTSYVVQGWLECLRSVDGVPLRLLLYSRSSFD